MSSEGDREVAELRRAIAQLHELKERLKTDVCINVMLEVLSDIIDDLCVDVCVHVHRCHRLDLIPLDQGGPAEAASMVVDAAGYDVHGQIPEKVPKNETFNCDHCGQKVGAAKFAAHLAKCMGHGGRQQRSRGGADAGAHAPAVSTSPSNPPPPPAQSTARPPVAAPCPSPAKRAPSPNKVVDGTDWKRPKGQYFDGEEV